MRLRPLVTALGTLVAAVLVLVLGVDALSRCLRQRWGADVRAVTP